MNVFCDTGKERESSEVPGEYEEEAGHEVWADVPQGGQGGVEATETDAELWPCWKTYKWVCSGWPLLCRPDSAWSRTHRPAREQTSLWVRTKETQFQRGNLSFCPLRIAQAFMSHLFRAFHSRYLFLGVHYTASWTFQLCLVSKDDSWNEDILAVFFGVFTIWSRKINQVSVCTERVFKTDFVW